VDAAAFKGIEIDRHSSHQGLAFTGFHLGYLALVQYNPTDELHVKGPHVHGPLGNFSHGRKGFDHKVVQPFASRQPGTELVGQSAQVSVGALLHLRFECIDGIDHGLELAYFALVRVADDFAQ
jgi:hypothetical protein